MEWIIHDEETEPVAPRAGAWIEITIYAVYTPIPYMVAPRAGAWIEMRAKSSSTRSATSLPVRERGLKSSSRGTRSLSASSLPVRERGLKSDWAMPHLSNPRVAPRAGAWIEIVSWYIFILSPRYVAPRAGAWIEISWFCSFRCLRPGRSPCGSVD